MIFYVVEVNSNNPFGTILVSTNDFKSDLATNVALGLAKQALQRRIKADPLIVSNEAESEEVARLLATPGDSHDLHEINKFLSRGPTGKTYNVISAPL